MERILIIDDNEEWTRKLTRELEFRCYQVTTADTAKKGIEAAMRREPDLIMVDIEPEGPGGFEIISRLAADEKTRRIPTAVLSARTRKDYVEQARNLGVCDFISKEDFHLGRMLSTVQLAILRRYAGANAKVFEPAVKVAREEGMVHVDFQGNIASKRFREEAKSVLNKAFLTRIQKEECVLDVRRVSVMDATALDSYMRLFGRRDLSLITGVHYGELMMHGERNAELFLSCGDYLLHLDAKKFQVKAAAG